MSIAIQPGMAVRIPAHGLAGSVATFWGAAPDRRVMVDISDGTSITVTERDIVRIDAATAAPPAPEVCSGGMDLVAFAGDLIQRTRNLTSEEARGLYLLAKGYLTLRGVTP